MGEIGIDDRIDNTPVKVCLDTGELNRKRLPDHTVGTVAGNQVSGLDDFCLASGLVDDVDSDWVCD